ncbi:MAG: hypothetical protein COB67_13410 [SAR324 cluster bacterium]|uniref:Flagellin N-terminal domain-containing protein n=1 Tax=SAR324 cluster bacterium TaxID=2024889 RepID=A0A2A4SNE9_9DELT|nr:MAG: hypothetical protein COB67_13410 [SAR324 cluster bacterium]
MIKKFNGSSPLAQQTGGSRRLDPSLRESGGMIPKVNPLPDNMGAISVIGKLESSVSRIQVAQKTLGDLAEILERMSEFMETKGLGNIQGIESFDVVNNYLRQELDHFQEVAYACNFQGQGVLNGEIGLIGKSSNKDLRFVRGSARVISSGTPGYPVTIYQEAKPGSLIGQLPLDREILKRETDIAFVEGNQQVHYRVRKDEDPESLIRNLQECLFNHGLDIRVTKTEDGRLYFIHNQLGRENNFYGISLNTKLISHTPGEPMQAKPGRDIKGTIGREQARGVGGFLIGNRGNPQTDGLILHYDGKIKFPGEIIGYIQVKQNGLFIPVDQTGEKTEVLSIPSLSPQYQAIGVSNASAFSNLDSIRADNREQSRDSLKLILWAIADLKQLREELCSEEDRFVNRTIELLQGSIRPLTASSEILEFSKDKAGEMADQLKSMLSPEIVA